MKPRFVLVTLVILALAVPASMLAQGSDTVVPVYKESHHRVRFDNGIVRVYEVKLRNGESTLFHEHAADNFAVRISTNTIVDQRLGEQSNVFSGKTGKVTLASTEKGPYTHRVGSIDDYFHVVDVEINRKSRLGPNVETPKRSEKHFTIVSETSRGRTYRMVLKASESTESFARPANTAIVALSGGRITEVTEGKPPRFWDSEPGSFRWVDAPEKLTIKNDGVMDLELIEIEIF
jgi:hypothetical protein